MPPADRDLPDPPATGGPPRPAAPTALEMTPWELSDWLQRAAAGSDSLPPRVIDVREEDEFAVCRLPGAELIPLGTLAERAAARLPDRAAPIVVYCHHGMRSFHAAHLLRRLGYARAVSLAGGIDRWSEEIDPAVPRY